MLINLVSIFTLLNIISIVTLLNIISIGASWNNQILVWTRCIMHPPSPSPPVLAPLAPCFTRLSLPPPPKTLHNEQVVIGRIFQALPTQTDTQTDIVVLIYKILWLLNTQVGTTCDKVLEMYNVVNLFIYICQWIYQNVKLIDFILFLM
jgi:hypothetical protein